MYKNYLISLITLFLAIRCFAEENKNCLDANFKLKEILASKDLSSTKIIPLTKKCDNEKILYNLSVAYLNEDNFEESINTLKDLLKKSKTSKYLNTLGNLYVKQSELTGALSAYKQALEMEVDNTDSLLGLGIVSARENKFKEAEKYFLKVKELDTDNLYAHYNLGLLYKSIADYKMAFNYFNRAYEIDPNFSEILYEIADIDMIENNYQDSINKLIILLNNDKNNVKAMELLSSSYYELYNFDKAIFWSKKALNLKPKSFPIKLQLAKSLLKNKQAFKARKILSDGNSTKECCQIDYLTTLSKIDIELGNFLSARNKLEQAKSIIKSEKFATANITKDSNQDDLNDKLKEVNDLLSEIALIN